jgi:hypothetical protein
MTKNDKTTDDSTAAGNTIATTTTATATTTTDTSNVVGTTVSTVTNDPALVTPAATNNPPTATSMSDMIRLMAMNTPADPVARTQYLMDVENMLQAMQISAVTATSTATAQTAAGQPNVAAPSTSNDNVAIPPTFSTPVSSNVYNTNDPRLVFYPNGPSSHARTPFIPYGDHRAHGPGIPFGAYIRNGHYDPVLNRSITRNDDGTYTTGPPFDPMNAHPFARANTPLTVETVFGDDDDVTRTTNVGSTAAANAGSTATTNTGSTAGNSQPKAVPIPSNAGATAQQADRFTNTDISSPFRLSTNIGNTSPNTGQQETADADSDSRPDLAAIFSIPDSNAPITRDMVQQINVTEEYIPDVQEDQESQYAHLFQAKLDLDPKVRESRRIASRKALHTTLKHVDPLNISKSIKDYGGAYSNVDAFLFNLQNRIDEHGWQYIFRVIRCDNLAPKGCAPVYAINYPVIPVHMAEKHGYKHLTLKTIRSWVAFAQCNLSDNQAERQIIKDDLYDSYLLILNSCDQHLRAQVESKLQTDTDYRQLHNAGPVALKIALDCITIADEDDARKYVNMMADIKLTSIQGEDITDYLTQCRGFINRIGDEKRTSEYYDIILDALRTCTVEQFVQDLQAWVSAREVTDSITVKKDSTALIKYALDRYTQLTARRQWLPTSKGKSTFFTPASKKEADSKPKSDSSDKKKKGKKEDKSPGAATTAAPAATTPTSANSAAEKRKMSKWKTTPPVAGETIKWNPDKTKSFKWCAKCELWTGHDTPGHKELAQLNAERAARNASNPNVSFSNGNIASSPV